MRDGENRPHHQLRLAGEYDLTNIAQLKEQLAEFEPGSTCEIDGAAVTFFDSAAIAALVIAVKRGVQVVVRTPSTTLDRALRVMGLAAMFGLESST